MLFMKRFQKILFVVDGVDIPDSAVNQVASVLKDSEAELSCLVLYPDLSKKVQGFKEVYEQGVGTALTKKLESAGISAPSSITFETATPFFVAVIQYVLQKNIDLVIKAAEPLEEQAKGFKSLDMSLLRKCPCPVWLCREFHNPNRPVLVTAVDPLAETEEGQDLNMKLLELGHSLSSSLNAAHKVISCWHFEYESYMRNSAFGKMDSEKVDELLAETDANHQSALDKLIADSGVTELEVERVSGRASDKIPEYAGNYNVDMVIMGTVARTGIPGFFIGNTAENILQNLSCGMFAVKPNGFVSPVKPYK